MQITGNGSTASQLHWYTDRTGGVLPTAWVASVPLLIYRLAMLAWALWLAFGLLRWLRWGWESVTTGGGWRPWGPVVRWRRKTADKRQETKDETAADGKIPETAEGGAEAAGATS